MKKRFRPPIPLLMIAAVLLVAGLAFLPLSKQIFSAKTLSTSIFVNGIPFLLVFIAILLTYIGIIVIVSRYFSGYITESRFKTVFYTPVVGIVLGIFMMFQPWAMIIYKIGFLLLLVSLFTFIAVSHIAPRKDFESAPAE